MPASTNSPNTRLRAVDSSDSAGAPETVTSGVNPEPPADSVAVDVPSQRKHSTAEDVPESSAGGQSTAGGASAGAPQPTAGGSSSLEAADVPELAACQPAQAAAGEPAALPQDAAEDECIVCFMPLSEEPVQTLACRHQFHQNCIREWLKQDGRCPCCRQVEDQAAADAAQARSRRPTASDPNLADWAGHQSLLTMRIVVAESRRLLALASVEAAMSALVMSFAHSKDIVSPVMMFLTAMVMIVAATRFSVKAAALCRPLLAFNIVYHVWMALELMHEYDGAL